MRSARTLAAVAIILSAPAVGSHAVAAAGPAETDVPANERPFGEDVILLLPTSTPPDVGRGWLERELLRQAVLVAGREELGLRTRDAHLRELDPWGGQIDLGAVVVSARGGGDVPAVLELKRPAKSGDTVWTVSVGPAGTGGIIAFAVEAEALSRGRLAEALRALGFPGLDDWPADPPLPGRDAVDAALYDEPKEDPPAELVDRFDSVSQFAAVRAWHGSMEAQGETPERLAGLVRGYANLGFLTAHHWSPASDVYYARSLLYAARMLHRAGETPESLRTRAYAFALLGLPAAALADLERAASPAGQGQEAPGWVAAVEAHSRGDRAELARLAGSGARPARLLARVLRLRDAELAGDGPAGAEAAEALREEEPACVLWLDARLRRSMPLGVEVAAQQEALSAARTWLYEPLAKSGIKLPAPIPGFDASDVAAEAKIRETYPADPFGYHRQRFDVGEPSLVAFGRMVQDEGFYQAWRVVVVKASALGVDADELIEQTRPWHRHHPFRRMLDAYARDRGSDDLPAVLAETKDEPQLPNYWFFYDWAEPNEEATRRKDIARRNADETVPDLVWLIDTAAGSPAERRRLTRALEEVAPNAAATAARLVRHDADRVADRIAGWEEQYRDEPAVMHAIADRHVALARYAAAVRCLTAMLEVTPSHETYTKLADAHLAAGDEEAFIGTLERAMGVPSENLEDAEGAERIARHHMRHGRWKEALPYAERAAESYWAGGLRCEADVREALGEYDKAEALHRVVSERYESSRHDWYFWCLRTGRGEVWAARRHAEPSLEFWRKWERHPKSDDENLGRLAFLDQVEGREAEALERYVRLSERTGKAYDALTTALIADGLGRHDVRDAHLRQAVTKGEQDEPVIGALARAMSETLAVPLEPPIGNAVSPQASPTAAQPVNAAPLDFDRGLDIIRRTSHMQGAATNGCYFLGRFLENRGRDEEANRAYGLAASSPATYKFAATLAAVALRRRGGEVPPRRGVELDGPTTRAVELYEQATRYSEKAEYLPALLRLEEALKARPDYIAALEAKGEMLTALERFREGAAAFEAVLAAAPHRVDVRLSRGRVLEYAGDHAAAIAEYERVLAAGSDVEAANDAHFMLAWLYAACADPAFRDGAAALRHVGEVKVTEQTPAWEVERTRAVALASASRFGEAVRIAEATIPQVPTEDRPMLRKQLDLYRAGQPYAREGEWWRAVTVGDD